MKMDRHKAQRNIGRLGLAMLAVLAVVVFRYAWLQLVQGSELSARMRAQVGENYLAQSTRGAILDRNGRELAVSTMTKSLYVDPNHVKEPEVLAADLAPLIGLSEQQVLDDIAEGGGFQWVKHHLPQEEYENVRQLMKEKEYTDCLNFIDEAKRYYPNDLLAANVLGFVGTEDKGLDGVEQALDGLLKGEVEEEFLQTDRSSRPILSSIFTRKQRYKGDYCKTVTLTIDSSIQFMVEQELDRAMAENGPKAITCIVMDPKNGDVLAAGKTGRCPSSMSLVPPSRPSWRGRLCRKMWSAPIRSSLTRAMSWCQGGASRTGAARVSAPLPSLMW